MKTEKSEAEKESYDCSFDFDEANKRKNYKFVVITKGDLDINNAMMLKTRNDLKNWIKELKQCYSFPDRVLAIIEIKKFLSRPK